MLYSVYMALHTWVIWIYLLVLGFNGISGILGIFGQEGFGFLAYAFIIGYYFFACKKLYFDSMLYRTGSGPGGDIAGQIIQSSAKTVAQNIG